MVTKDCEMTTMINQDLGKEMETVDMQVKSGPCHAVARSGRFLGIFLVRCLLFVWLVILTVLYVKLGQDYGRLREKFDNNAKVQTPAMINFAKSMQEQTDNKLVSSERSLRRYVDGLLLTKNSTTHEETSVKVHALRPQLNTSLEKGREVVDSLISALDNLKANLSSFANSSDSTMRRFRSTIEELTSRFVLAQKDLTRINASLRTELEEVSDSTHSVGKVRRMLSVFRNATASKIARMTSDLNETNANVVNMLKIFYRQNSSYYSHVHDKTAALVLKMEDTEMRMWNFTATDLRRFRGDLNETKENLRLTRAELLRSNTSVYTLIQTQKASVESMNGRIGGLRKDFDSEKKLGVAQQKTTRDEISKVKAEFKESLKEEKEASSALERKMMRKQSDIETGQRSQGNRISGLQRKVNKMQEKVNKAVNNKASVGLSVSTSLFIMGACACFLFV